MSGGTGHEAVTYHPIGVIHGPHVDPKTTPIQPVFAKGVQGRVEVFPEYAEGLDDLDGFSHVYLIYHFDRSPGARLKVKPFLQDTPRGVFATRAPARPNPIGFSVVRLLRRDGATLFVEDLDVLDGTPLLDIKPFVTRFDFRQGARCGWQDDVSDDAAAKRGTRETGGTGGGFEQGAGN